ncbi:MAG: hypothetical protein RLO15_11135 [Parvibaculum sp.]
MPPDRGGDSPPNGRRTGGEGREVIFEFIPVGGSVKVTAIDVATGLEVSVIGPSIAAQSELQNIAARKLRYMLEKKKEDKPNDKPQGGGGGIVV